MNPERLQQEATAYKYAFQGGIVTAAEVVAWADLWIWKLDDLPEALVEVSCNEKRVNEMYKALGQLSEAQLSLNSLALICQMLREWLRANPNEYSDIVESLPSLVLDNSILKNVRDEFNSFYYRYDVAQIYDEYRVQNSLSLIQRTQVLRRQTWPDRFRILTAFFHQLFKKEQMLEPPTQTAVETVADVERDFLAFLDRNSVAAPPLPKML